MIGFYQNKVSISDDGKPYIGCCCKTETDCVFPEIYRVFPVNPGGIEPPVQELSWANYHWRSLDISEYDPVTGLWLRPPIEECRGENDNRIFEFWGWPSILWDGDPEMTGAKTTCVPGVINCPILPYHFLKFVGRMKNIYNDHMISFEYEDIPDKTPLSHGVKAGHMYTWKTYDIDVYPEKLLCQGKMKIDFASVEIHFFDIDNPSIDLYGYALDGGMGGVSVDVTVSFYDLDENLIWSYPQSFYIPEVYSSGCIPDIDYSVIGKCDFSNSDCEGCLKSVSLSVVTDEMGKKLNGNCKNISAITKKGSYKYTLLSSGFETIAEANDYIDENYEKLMNSMKSNCSGKSWYIVGKCECNESTCAQCLAVDGSVSVMCEDEIEDCFEDGGTYYKLTKLADGQAFSNLMEASDYLGEHSDELEESLGEICSPCDDAMIAMTISWSGNPGAVGIGTRTVDGHLEVSLMGYWWRQGQRIIECVGVNYSEDPYGGWSVWTSGFSGASVLLRRFRLWTGKTITKNGTSRRPTTTFTATAAGNTQPRRAIYGYTTGTRTAIRAWSRIHVSKDHPAATTALSATTYTALPPTLKALTEAGA